MEAWLLVRGSDRLEPNHGKDSWQEVYDRHPAGCHINQKQD